MTTEDQDNLEYIECLKIEKEWKESLPFISIRDFPDAVATWKVDLKKWRSLRAEFAKDSRDCPPKYDGYYTTFIDDIDGVMMILEDLIFKYMPQNIKSDDMPNAQDVKESVDIVEIAQRYMKLEQVGAEHRGLCPFHNEKTPSFHINKAKQVYHCFGCQVSGDVIDLYMRLEDVNFIRAIQELNS